MDNFIPPCYQVSDLNLKGYHLTLHFKPLQLTSKQTNPTVLNQIHKSKQKVSPFSNTDANYSWDENPSPCSTLDRYAAVA